MPADEAPSCGIPVKNATPDEIRALLRGSRTVAVVGVSDRPERDSHRVARYLINAGYEVYLVNPLLKELWERPVYPDLRSLPAGVRIDVVDIFRRPEAVPPIVEDAVSIGARAVWMQEGVVNNAAAARARAAGLVVVMDRCMMKEHRKSH